MEKKTYPVTRKTLTIYLILAFVGTIFINIAVDYFQATSPLGKDAMTEFNQIVQIVESRYVDDVEKEKLIKEAIDGMLTRLDPYSQYLDRPDYDDLVIHSRGEFGGLGIRIALRDEVITVIAPMEGTPAKKKGIIAGDQIIAVEGEPTTGWTVQDAVDALRGPKGSDVTITIYRPGLDESMDFTIVRDTIAIESVPYAFMLTDDIGYIGLVEFSEKTAYELQQNIETLRAEGARGLILDLRNNPGGLLEAAIDVSDQFLDRGELIVYTRGRTENQNQEFKASRRLKATDDLLLSVLVNQGSASASEIVAGAIQDHDLGLIIGEPTFGKGSVQSLFPISDHKALKLTTAKYYTPSGRCIHKDTHPMFSEATVVDSITAEMDDPAEKEIYYTDKGRKVYGGGGITPDIIQENDPYPLLVQNIFRQGLLFNFAVDYAAMHSDADMTVSNALLSEFKAHLRASDVTFTDDDFEAAMPVIERELRRDLASILVSEAEARRVSLEGDQQVERALSFLEMARSKDALIELAMAEQNKDEEPTR